MELTMVKHLVTLLVNHSELMKEPILGVRIVAIKAHYLAPPMENEMQYLMELTMVSYWVTLLECFSVLTKESLWDMMLANSKARILAPLTNHVMETLMGLMMMELIVSVVVTLMVCQSEMMRASPRDVRLVTKEVNDLTPRKDYTMVPMTVI